MPRRGGSDRSGRGYQRAARTGDAGGAEVEAKRPGAICSLPECTRPHYAHDLCKLHYGRRRKHGDPSTVLPGPWKGDDAGYSAVHERLNTTRGHASEHTCAKCGAPASDWAYDLTCPNEKRGLRHGMLLAYSTDPARYMPLCPPCQQPHEIQHLTQRRSDA